MIIKLPARDYWIDLSKVLIVMVGNDFNSTRKEDGSRSKVITVMLPNRDFTLHEEPLKEDFDFFIAKWEEYVTMMNNR